LGVAELRYDFYVRRSLTIEKDKMKCPECGSHHIHKNGIKKGKQNHICVDCGRQFIDSAQKISRGYSDEVRRECLKMYVNGMGFRAIERVKGIHHTTIIHWVKIVGKL
jgi:transposase-like protein